MYTMGSAHHNGILIFQSICLEDFHEVEYILSQDGIGTLETQTIGCIDNVSGCNTIMDPLLFFTKGFGYTSCKCNNIMSCFLFNFVNTINCELCIVSDFFHILCRNFTKC